MRIAIKRKIGMTNKPNLIDDVKSITKPTKNGPKIAQMFPNIENSANADNWLEESISFVITLLLDAWIGPIKKPIVKASNQKRRMLLIKNSNKEQINRKHTQSFTFLREPNLSSILPNT